MDDDLVCEYDSTWDTESDGDELENSSRCKKTRPAFWSNSFSRNLRAAKDMQTYRHGYPNMNEDECPEERMTNLKFYLNEIKSSPDDVSIEAFHTEWRTDYKRLERVHSYIQWLFPLREPGVNYMAAELTKKEIQAFRENEEAKSRLLDSYELMLGFYGIQLVNRESGEVKRADNWRERFVNLEKNLHNNLRITRILKSLGELGFEHFQAPLVCFFLEETLVRKTLSSIKRSVLDYFLFAVRDKRERRKLVQFAFQHFEPKDKFVWCPRKIQKRFKKKSEKRQNSAVDNGESVTDEGHSQCKYRDEETINVPKFSKPADELLKANKNVDVDFVLDTEKHSEEETEDHELHLGDCCADLPLNDRLGLDVGEMDDFNVAEENGAEGNGMDGHNELLEIQPDQEVMLCAKWEAVAGSTSECPLASPDDSEKNHQETSSGGSEEDTTPEDPPTLSLELPGNASDTRSGVETLSTTQEQQQNRESVNGPERGEPMDIVDSSPE